MGNLSKRAKATVKVTLESNIILPGEIVNGKINIQPKKNSDITKLQNPKIEIGIYQEQNWKSFIFSQEDKQSRNGESNTNIYSNQTLNCSEFKDKNFSEGIIIPFQYKVPEDITPSFEWPHTKYEFASIRNFLTVNIQELAFKTRILLIILKRPDPHERPLKFKVVEERKKLLLFGTGSIIVEGSYPKYSYPILGNIPLTVKIDASKSNVLIKDVTVKLKRKLEFYSKTNNKISKTILQNMYVETRKVCSKSEDLLFNIPFKDSKEIEYYMTSSPLGENTEICCLIPNITTNTMNVKYYIKISADPDDLLAKKIELKMNVDFYSKDDENQSNINIYDNFNNQVNKINSGEVDINNMEPYLQYQFTNVHEKRLSQSLLSHQYTLNNTPNQSQSVLRHQYTLNNPSNQYYLPNDQNYQQNNYNQFLNNSFNPNYQNINQNNINYSNYQNNNINMNNNINNNMNINNNINYENVQNNQNVNQFPSVPNNNLNEEEDLPTLDEIEEYNKNKEKNNQQQSMDNTYPIL